MNDEIYLKGMIHEIDDLVGQEVAVMFGGHSLDFSIRGTLESLDYPDGIPLYHIDTGTCGIGFYHRNLVMRKGNQIWIRDF